MVHIHTILMPWREAISGQPSAISMEPSRTLAERQSEFVLIADC